MIDVIFKLILVALVLITVWYVAERFSPDPLVTKLVQVGLFVVALYVVWKSVLPLVGIG